MKRPIRYPQDPFFKRNVTDVTFQDRQSQTLTDEQIDTALAVDKISPDQIKNNPKLTPKETVKVNSVFDTRPINASDFFKSGGSIVFSTTTFGDDTETASFTFPIPKGYVAVLRGFEWSFDPVYVQSSIVSVVTALFIDGLAVRFLDIINDIQDTPARIPTHLIIDEETELKINTVRQSGISLASRGLATTDVTYIAEFYGNMLQKRNLPPNFEIGSFVKK